MARNFGLAIENPHRSIGSQQCQRAPYVGWRYRVVIEVETNVDSLAGSDGKNQIGIERVCRQGKKIRLFLFESLLYGFGVVPGQGRRWATSSRQRKAWRLKSSSVVKGRAAK